jgi:hypothetical protein
VAVVSACMHIMIDITEEISTCKQGCRYHTDCMLLSCQSIDWGRKVLVLLASMRACIRWHLQADGVMLLLLKLVVD